MESRHNSEPSVQEVVASRGEPACDVDGSLWSCGSVICRIKLLTSIPLVAFVLIGSALGLF